jgi:hypothetical protein
MVTGEQFLMANVEAHLQAEVQPQSPHRAVRKSGDHVFRVGMVGGDAEADQAVGVSKRS